MCCLLIDVKAPISVYHFLRDNELCAIPKGDTDVRPIGMGNSIRKICSTLFLTFVNTRAENGSFNDLHFGKVQLGMAEGGCEKIIHSVRTHAQLYPDKDFFFSDADNAFNRISRNVGLAEVKKHFPFFFPFISQIYGKDSNGWFIADSDIIPIRKKKKKLPRKSKNVLFSQSSQFSTTTPSIKLCYGSKAFSILSHLVPQKNFFSVSSFKRYFYFWSFTLPSLIPQLLTPR